MGTVGDLRRFSPIQLTKICEEQKGKMVSSRVAPLRVGYILKKLLPVTVGRHNASLEAWYAQKRRFSSQHSIVPAPSSGSNSCSATLHRGQYGYLHRGICCFLPMLVTSSVLSSAWELICASSCKNVCLK